MNLQPHIPDQAWPELYQTIEGFVHSRIKDKDEAQDLVQDTMVKMLTKLPQLKSSEKLVPWMYQIARNTVNDYYRKKRPDYLEEKFQVERSEKLDDDLTIQFAQCIIPMIHQLPETYREAIYLTEIKGLTQKEMGTHLGISHAGAKSRVQRGREKLKDILLECCTIHTDCYGNVVDYHKN